MPLSSLSNEWALPTHHGAQLVLYFLLPLTLHPKGSRAETNDNLVADAILQ